MWTQEEIDFVYEHFVKGRDNAVLLNIFHDTISSLLNVYKARTMTEKYSAELQQDMTPDLHRAVDRIGEDFQLLLAKMVAMNREQGVDFGALFRIEYDRDPTSDEELRNFTALVIAKYPEYARE